MRVQNPIRIHSMYNAAQLIYGLVSRGHSSVGAENCAWRLGSTDINTWGAPRTLYYKIEDVHEAKMLEKMCELTVTTTVEFGKASTLLSDPHNILPAHQALLHRSSHYDNHGDLLQAPSGWHARLFICTGFSSSSQTLADFSFEVNSVDA